jgi:hypothetical protein
MAKADQIPMHPDNKLLAFDRAEEYLRQGKVIAIFPEARLNPERQLIRSGTGAVHLSLITGAPVIPIGFYVPAQCLRYIGRQKKTEYRRDTGRLTVTAICISGHPGSQAKILFNKKSLRKGAS